MVSRDGHGPPLGMYWTDAWERRMRHKSLVASRSWAVED
jgi:hypothetical protein